MTVCYRTNV